MRKIIAAIGTGIILSLTAVGVAQAHRNANCTVNIVPIQNQTNPVGTHISNGLPVFAYGGSGVFRFYAYNLPPDLTINRITGWIGQGTESLTKIGSYNITVKATDQRCSAQTEFNWTVTP